MARAEAKYVISAEDRTALGLKSATDRLKRFDQAVSVAVRGTGALVSAEVLRRSVLFADQYNVINQRIRTATRLTGEYEKVQAELLRTSIETGAVFEENVATFQALSRVQDDIGATTDEMLTLTQTINQLGVIGGSSTTAMQNGLRQFNQGLAAGIFRAEEFNSIVENIPEVAARIAGGLGKTQGELRQLVLEGRLFSRDVMRVLLEQSQGINEEFQEIPVSVSRATTSLTTATGALLSNLDNSLGLTQLIARGIQSMADALADAGPQTVADAYVENYRKAREEMLAATDEHGKRMARSEMNAYGDEVLRLARETPTPAAISAGLEIADERLGAAIDRMHHYGSEGKIFTETINGQRLVIDENVKSAWELVEVFRAYAEAQERSNKAADEAAANRRQGGGGLTDEINTEFENTTDHLRRVQRLREQAAARAHERRLVAEAGFDDEAHQLAFEREAQLHDARMERIALANEEETALVLGYRDARHQAIVEQEMSHHDRMLQAQGVSNANQRRAIVQMAQFERMTAVQRSQFVLTTATQLTASLAQTNETAFRINQVAAIADATISTYRAIASVFAEEKGGLGRRLAAAAVAAAYGFAQVSAIASTSFGGGSPGASGVGAGSGIPSEGNRIPGEAFATPTATEAGQNEAAERVLRVEVTTGSDEPLTRAIADSLRVSIEDDDLVIIPPTSRQAQDIVAGQ